MPRADGDHEGNDQGGQGRLPGGAPQHPQQYHQGHDGQYGDAKGRAKTVVNRSQLLWNMQ